MDGDVAGEMAGDFRSRILLVGKAIQAHAEGEVGAGAPKGEFIFTSAMLKGLRGEGLSELRVEQPTAEGFTVGK